MSVFTSHQINPLWAKLLFKPHHVFVLLKPGNVSRWRGHLFPSPVCHFIPERGYGPRWNPRCDLYSWVHLSLFLSLFFSFSFHQVPVCWSKAAGSAANPPRDHSYCKPTVCPVGSDTHTNRLHNHALFPCHNTLDWFIIVQLALTRRLCLQKHFHIRPYACIDCYSPLTDKLLLHARPLFNAVLR